MSRLRLSMLPALSSLQILTILVLYCIYFRHPAVDGALLDVHAAFVFVCDAEMLDLNGNGEP
jgi:hypothetical protein